MSKPNWALLAIPAGLAAYWYSKNRPTPEPDPDPEIDCLPGWDLIDGECVEPYTPDPEPDPEPDPDPVPDPMPDPVPDGQTDAPWDGQLLIKGAAGPLVTALQRVLCFLGHGSPFGNKDDVDVEGVPAHQQKMGRTPKGRPDVIKMEGVLPCSSCDGSNQQIGGWWWQFFWNGT